MATEQDNICINTFSEGMDTDTSPSQIKNTKYNLAINARIGTNIDNYDDSVYQNNQEGTLHNVECYNLNIQCKNVKTILKAGGIIKTVQCGDICLLFQKGSIQKNGNLTRYINVIRFYKTDSTVSAESLFNIIDKNNINNISVVLNKETEDVVNLYMADGYHKIMQLNILDKDYIESITLHDTNLDVYYIDPEYIEQNSFFPVKPIYVNKTICGQLKTSQIQYTYLFYKKHGIRSKLAPLTNKIQVISNNKDIEKGNAEDTETDIGFQLKLPSYDELDNVTKTYLRTFDHYQIYRIQYLKPNSNPEIHLISDGKLTDNLLINDVSQDSLQTLSLEEYNSINGQSFIPKVIEQNQNYLFAGDITDNTVLDIENIDFSTYSITTNIDNQEYYLYSDGSGTDYRALIENKPDINNIISSIKTSVQNNKDINVDNVYNASTDINRYKTYNLNDTTLNQFKSPIKIQYESLYNPFNYDNSRSDKYYLGGFNEYIQWRLVTFEFNQTGNDITSSENTTKKYIYYNKQTNKLDIENTTVKATDYIKSKGINTFNLNTPYQDIYSSSLMRSLKRGEVYRYGIVFYDKHGNKSNVYFVADIKIPNICDFDILQDGIILPIGVEFSLNVSESYLREYNIVGYEIVRCDKPSTYTKNIKQCVLAKPVIQSSSQITNVTNVPFTTINKALTTPFYPSGFLTTQPLRYYWDGGSEYSNVKAPWPNNVFAETRYNQTIFQIFNPTFLYNRETELTNIQHFDKIQLLKYIYTNKNFDNFSLTVSNENNSNPAYGSLYDYCKFYINRCDIKCDKEYKESEDNTCYYFDEQDTVLYVNKDASRDKDMKYNDHDFTGEAKNIDLKNQEVTYNIKSIKDAKTIGWNEVFSQVQLSGDKVKTAIKQYKNFVQNIGTQSYVNFVCCGKYNSKVGTDSEQLFPSNSKWGSYMELSNKDSHSDRPYKERGPISTGGQCFITNIDVDSIDDKLPFNPLNRLIFINDNTSNVNNIRTGTFLCNIQHTAQQFSGNTIQQKQYDIYYGYGNYKYIEFDKNCINTVFDGTTYIAPYEFITSHMAYNFNDVDNLQSMSVINYVVMEDDTNPFFAYGQSFRNTNNKNVQQKPSVIDGVYSQDRPAYQYNSIYSDNYTSISIYNIQTYEKTEKHFPCRICYSQLKTIGENIDNWQIFKAADYIDCNSKYGNITHMFTTRNVLYCWQQYAFCKLAVNERSLVTDNNSNTIQLGQGSVLQRIDYLSDKYGMYTDDMCSIDCEGMLFWFDKTNQCIALYQENTVINYTDKMHVNRLMRYTINNNPKLSYDAMHKELHFSSIHINSIYYNNNNDDFDIVFNIKQGFAQSLFEYNSRDCINIFDLCVNIINTMDEKAGFDYGTTTNNISLFIFNNCYNIKNMSRLNLTLVFTSNNLYTITKVFDNQQIVLENISDCEFKEINMIYYTDIIKNPVSSCDIYDEDNIRKYSNREGNMCYPLPRVNDNNNMYGNRIRGKWMTNILYTCPNNESISINTIITKFRKSYS